MKSAPDLYDYWPYRNRPKIVWPGGTRLAFWVAPNIEFYELDPPANPMRTRLAAARARRASATLPRLRQPRRPLAHDGG